MSEWTAAAIQWMAWNMCSTLSLNPKLMALLRWCSFFFIYLTTDIHLIVHDLSVICPSTRKTTVFSRSPQKETQYLKIGKKSLVLAKCFKKRLQNIYFFSRETEKKNSRFSFFFLGSILLHKKGIKKRSSYHKKIHVFFFCEFDWKT